MSNCALEIGGHYESAGAVSASSRGTALGTSYTELIASTGYDYEGFFFEFHTQSNLNDVLIDIGIGAGGSETTLIEDIYSGGFTTAHGYSNAGSMFIPIRIPKGTRVAARSTSGVNAAIIGCNGAPGRMNGFAGALTWGVGGGNGTTLQGNASANNEGAYTEFVASTDRPIKAIMAAFGRNGNTTMADADFLLDIAIGAAASEQVLIPNMVASSAINPDSIQPRIRGPFAVSIPTGTRIAARLQSSTNDATDSDLDAVLYGFY